MAVNPELVDKNFRCVFKAISGALWAFASIYVLYCCWDIYQDRDAPPVELTVKQHFGALPTLAMCFGGDDAVFGARALPKSMTNYLTNQPLSDLQPIPGLSFMMKKLPGYGMCVVANLSHVAPDFTAAQTQFPFIHFAVQAQPFKPTAACAAVALQGDGDWSRLTWVDHRVGLDFNLHKDIKGWKLGYLTATEAWWYGEINNLNFLSKPWAPPGTFEPVVGGQDVGGYNSSKTVSYAMNLLISSPTVSQVLKLGLAPQIFTLVSKVGGFASFISFVLGMLFVRKYPKSSVAVAYDVVTLRGNQDEQFKALVTDEVPEVKDMIQEDGGRVAQGHSVSGNSQEPLKVRAVAKPFSFCTCSERGL